MRRISFSLCMDLSVLFLFIFMNDYIFLFDRKLNMVEGIEEEMAIWVNIQTINLLCLNNDVLSIRMRLSLKRSTP